MLPFALDNAPVPGGKPEMFMNFELAGSGSIGPTDRSYWVIPGHLAAGAYPNPDPFNDKVGQLLNAGVKLFVNLTQDYPTGTDAHMNRYDIRAADRHAIMVRRDIPDNGVTTGVEMAATLDIIDRHLGHGCAVYVHCWGGSGRTGTVVGCWLRRHGYAASHDVIGMIRALRKQGDRKGGHKDTPQTWDQQAMVKGWQTGS